MKVTKKAAVTGITIKEGEQELTLSVCPQSGNLEDFDSYGDVSYFISDLRTASLESLLEADPDDFDLLVEMLKVAREEFIKNRENK